MREHLAGANTPSRAQADGLGRAQGRQWEFFRSAGCRCRGHVGCAAVGAAWAGLALASGDMGGRGGGRYDIFDAAVEGVFVGTRDGAVRHKRQ